MSETKAQRRNGLARTDGMTAIELLIVISAIAVLVLVAVPGSSMLLARHHLNSASGDLLSALNRAKNEAASRNSTVRVCPSSDGRVCRRDGDWGAGWLVYTDGNGDGKVQDIERIEAFDAPSDKVRIVARGAVATAASFNLTGLVPAAGQETGGFQICYPESRLKPRIIAIEADAWVHLLPVEDPGCIEG